MGLKVDYDEGKTQKIDCWEALFVIPFDYRIIVWDHFDCCIFEYYWTWGSFHFNTPLTIITGIITDLFFVIKCGCMSDINYIETKTS